MSIRILIISSDSADDFYRDSIAGDRIVSFRHARDHVRGVPQNRYVLTNARLCRILRAAITAIIAGLCIFPLADYTHGGDDRRRQRRRRLLC